MNAIYFFQESNVIDYNLKSYLTKFNIDLEYETRLSNLLTKIIVMRPTVLFVNESTEFSMNILKGLFNEDSPFFVPLVIMLQSGNGKDFEMELENFAVINERNKSVILPAILEKIKDRKTYYLKKTLFPFTKFDEITGLLFKMGFSIKNQGTVFIKDCISYFLCDVGNFSYNLGKVYSVVSAMHSTLPSNMERCIRIAINNVWKNLNPQVVAERIGVDPIFFEHKPTCREIILFVGELILDRAKEAMLQNEITVNQYQIVGINS